MKASVIHEHGGTDKLKYEEVDQPEIEPNEVLIKVKACALNHLDVWVRGGLPGVKIPMPHILGSDISGVVKEIGSVVKNVKVGDKVLLHPGVSCGYCNECLSGNDNICRSYTLLGYLVDGGYAEYVKAPSVNVVPIPNGLNFEEAASVPLVFLTAWHMLVTRADVKAGEDILVLAAGSGVGSAGIQIAKLLGSRVIATASTDEKLEKARGLGADDVINYTNVDFADEVKRLTGKKGVEVVFEHIGSETWDKSIKSLAKNGRLVTCGATSGPKVELDVRVLFSKHLTLFGSYMGGKAELLDLLRFFETGQLKPVIDQVLPLKDAAKAHELMMERKQFGKLVLVP